MPKKANRIRMHVGGDYLHVILPGGGALEMRYPDEEDVRQVRELIRNRNVIARD